MIAESAITALKDQLKSAKVYTPDSEGYHDKLQRWSDTGSKPAVCHMPRIQQVSL
jgi:hypothetical protein